MLWKGCKVSEAETSETSLEFHFLGRSQIWFLVIFQWLWLLGIVLTKSTCTANSSLFCTIVSMLSKQTIILSLCSQKAATMELTRDQMVGWRTAKVLLPSKARRNLWHFFTSRIVRHTSGLISPLSLCMLRSLLGDGALHLSTCIMVRYSSIQSFQIYHRLIFLLLSF